MRVARQLVICALVDFLRRQAVFQVGPVADSVCS